MHDGKRAVAATLGALAVLVLVVGGAAFGASRLLDDDGVIGGGGGGWGGREAVGTGVADEVFVDWVECGAVDCVRFRVADTIDAVDEGLTVRECVDESPCPVRAYAAEHQEVFATCRLDGMAVDGDTAWVRSPWWFRLPSIEPGRSMQAAATGNSAATSEEFGWVSARYLDPREGVEDLPLCDDALAAAARPTRAPTTTAPAVP